MKKKKQNDYLFYIILFLVIITLLFLASFSFIKDITKNNYSDSKYKTVTIGTSEDGDVAIDITPLSFSNDEIEFKISANTHSIDLSKYSLKEIVTLQYESKTIKPIE